MANRPFEIQNKPIAFKFSKLSKIRLLLFREAKSFDFPDIYSLRDAILHAAVRAEPNEHFFNPFTRDPSCAVRSLYSSPQIIELFWLGWLTAAHLPHFLRNRTERHPPQNRNVKLKAVYKFLVSEGSGVT